MNKVVLEHYPASKLPDDLRGSIAAGASVRVIVEEEPASRRMSRGEFLESLAVARRNAPGTTVKEAVDRIRGLRDEWDD